MSILLSVGQRATKQTVKKYLVVKRDELINLIVMYFSFRIR